MAFTSTILGSSSFGNMKVSLGTYTNTASSTGGDIDTGLSGVRALFLQPKTTAISANQPVVNETLPQASSAVTIVTSADEVGFWFAIGI